MAMRKSKATKWCTKIASEITTTAIVRFQLQHTQWQIVPSFRCYPSDPSRGRWFLTIQRRTSLAVYVVLDNYPGILGTGLDFWLLDRQLVPRALPITHAPKGHISGSRVKVRITTRENSNLFSCIR